MSGIFRTGGIRRKAAVLFLLSSFILNDAILVAVIIGALAEIESLAKINVNGVSNEPGLV
jgi:hypothetical protein